MTTKEDTESKNVKRLIEVIEDIYPSNKELAWKSFLRGIFVGLGTTIGASIVVAILTYTVGQLKLFPVIKQLITQTNVEQILQQK